MIDALYDRMADFENRTEPEPIPQRRNEGGSPCGECHLNPGETCDICGAVEPANTWVRLGDVEFPGKSLESICTEETA